MFKWILLALVWSLFQTASAETTTDRIWSAIQSDTFPHQLKYEFEDTIAQVTLNELPGIPAKNKEEFTEAVRTVIIYHSLTGNFHVVDSLIQVSREKYPTTVNELIATKLYIDWLPCAQQSETEGCQEKALALQKFLRNNFITDNPDEAMRWHWTAKMLNDSVLIEHKSKDFTFAPQLSDTDNQPGYPGAVLAVNRFPNTQNILVSNGYREPVKLFEQNNKSEWKDITEPSGLSQIPGGEKMYAVDINNDGFQDILILRNFSNPRLDYLYPSLLMNQKDGTYKDIAAEAGFDIPQRSVCACFLDANEDGLLDIFLGGEKYSSLLFIQKEDGTFKESANAYGIVTKPQQIMDCAVADINNDGKNDLLLSTFYHSNFSFEYKRLSEEYPFFINTYREHQYHKPFKGGIYLLGDYDGNQSINIISNTDHSFIDKYLVFNILSGTSGPDEFPTMWELDSFEVQNTIEQYSLLTYARAAINIDKGHSRPYILFGGGRHLDELYPLTFYQFLQDYYFYQLLALEQMPTHINSMTVTPNPKTYQPVIWMKGGFPNSKLKNQVVTYIQSNDEGTFFTLRLQGKQIKDALGALVTVTITNNQKKETQRTRLIQAVSSDGKGAGQDIWFLPAESQLKEITVQWPNGNVQSVKDFNLKRSKYMIEIEEE